jgi:thiol-disulfide isomerase/thioredoxin
VIPRSVPKRSRLAAVVAIAGCGASTPPTGAGAADVPKVVQLNRTGELIDVDAELVPDHVTVVDFWAAWCEACNTVEARLMSEISAEPAIVIRKVDVGDGTTPVARAYQIGALPHFRIFDRERRLRYVLVGNDTLQAGELARALVTE